MELDDFVQQFPEFQLGDELLVLGGRDIMWGLTFGRRKKHQEGAKDQI